MKRHQTHPPQAAGEVRIIGGHWRGSKLPVVSAVGLRPTADRVRETLFNWLQSELPGARALDLFAGTGALGFEAASRGAASVDFVESDVSAVQTLREAERRLNADGRVAVRIHRSTAAAFLAAEPGPADPWTLVFIDPPFAAGLWKATFDALSPRLAERAQIYVESPKDAALSVPAGWSLHRELSTRETCARLYRVGMG